VTVKPDKCQQSKQRWLFILIWRVYRFVVQYVLAYQICPLAAHVPIYWLEGNVITGYQYLINVSATSKGGLYICNSLLCHVVFCLEQRCNCQKIFFLEYLLFSPIRCHSTIFPHENLINRIIRYRYNVPKDSLTPFFFVWVYWRIKANSLIPCRAHVVLRPCHVPTVQCPSWKSE
jgi:hypothetical protein